MQNLNVLFLATYELALSLVFGVVSVVLATKLLNRFVLSSPVEKFIRERHLPGCLISGSLIFSMVFLVRGAIEQSTLALQASVAASGGMALKPLGIALVHFVVFYLVSFVIAFLALFVTLELYRMLMRQIDLDDEIERMGNLALSVFLSINLIGVVLFIDKPLSHLIGSLVFYEQIGRL